MRTEELDYGALETRLRALLLSVTAWLADSDIAQIREFLEHGEYGVALTWMAHALVEDEAPVPELYFREIANLANVMGIYGDLPAEFEIDYGPGE